MGMTRPNKEKREMIMDVTANGERDIPRDRLWSVEEVSYYLGVPVGTLYSWRGGGAGPRGRGVGRSFPLRPGGGCGARPGVSANRSVPPLSAGGCNGVVRWAG